jgi:YHS domain-containing protein
MYALLVRFLLFLATFWLIQRILGFVFRVNLKKPDSAPSGPGASASKDTVKDPICGMYMDPRLAIHLENGKESFYFCSEECQRKFLSMPRT